MNRLAAMQDWPLFWTRAVTAVLTASSRSADGITMNGSLPPSSSTVGLISSPATAPTDWPAGSLPVRVAAVIREAAARDHIGQIQRALRHVRGVLENADVASHQRRRGEPDGLPERKVP